MLLIQAIDETLWYKLKSCIYFVLINVSRRFCTQHDSSVLQVTQAGRRYTEQALQSIKPTSVFPLALVAWRWAKAAMALLNIKDTY